MGMVWMYVYMCRYLYLKLKAFLGLARPSYIGRVIECSHVETEPGLMRDASHVRRTSHSKRALSGNNRSS